MRECVVQYEVCKSMADCAAQYDQILGAFRMDQALARTCLLYVGASPKMEAGWPELCFCLLRDAGNTSKRRKTHTDASRREIEVREEEKTNATAVARTRACHNVCPSVSDHFRDVGGIY